MQRIEIHRLYYVVGDVGLPTYEGKAPVRPALDRISIYLKKMVSRSNHLKEKIYGPHLPIQDESTTGHGYPPAETLT